MTPQEIRYLRDKAQAAGYSADDLLKVIDYESSGRPSVWGGKGDKYFGLIQFGPNERKQFGVDTKNPSATNQIDATMKYLAARGFKPGMDIFDLYSTINAGSPGHYNRSDGAGTVSQHVARMTGDRMAYSAKPSASPSNITELLASHPETKDTYAPLPQMPVGLIGIRKAAMSMPEDNTDDENAAVQQAMLDFHKQQHAKALGLLGVE